MEIKKYSLEFQNSKLDVPGLIDDLGSAIPSERLKARLWLIRAGSETVPALIQVLSTGNTRARWESAKALAAIRDPMAAPALVQALEDADHDVRWTAMKALIVLNRNGLESLLQALMRDFESVWLREGAHHILNVLKNQRQLRQPSLHVLQALEGMEPEVTVPMAAEEAWESLFGSGKKE